MHILDFFFFFHFADALLCPCVKQQGGEKPKGPLEALRPKLQVLNQFSNAWFGYSDTALWLDSSCLLMCECLLLDVLSLFHEIVLYYLDCTER